MGWDMRPPSMNALRAFEAAARLGSVSRAAGELNLTRSAISHQLRLLEQDLEVKLVKREGRGIALTVAGRRYARQVERALRLLRERPAAVDMPALTGSLTISCVPGFASFWLCRQIGDFHATYPDIQLRIVTPRALGDVVGPAADIYIAFGHGDWPDRWVEHLTGLEFFPACSPGLLNKVGGLNTPEDLARCTLLHLVDPTDWRRWLASARVRGVDPDGGVMFSDIHLAMSAAMAGQGIIIGDALVCGEALRQGHLIRPFAQTVSGTGDYYLVAEHDLVDRPEIVVFRTWLRDRLSEDLGTMLPPKGQTP